MRTAIQAGGIFSDGDESRSGEMIGQSPTRQDRHTGPVPSACHIGAALSHYFRLMFDLIDNLRTNKEGGLGKSSILTAMEKYIRLHSRHSS